MKSRKVIQIFFLFVFILLIGMAKMPYSPLVPSNLFLRFDPLAFIYCQLSARAYIFDLLPSIATVFLTIFLGRVFCGWICPMGTTIDLAEMAVYGKRSRLREKNKALSRLKYFILTALLISSFFGSPFFFLLDPIPLLSRIYTIIFYPLIMWILKLGLFIIRPIANLLSLTSLSYLELHPPLFFQLFLTFSIFCFIVGLSYIEPRFFCRNLCPLGALLGLLSGLNLFRKSVSDKCTDCGICLKFCPTNAVEEKIWKDRESECIKCLDCQVRCPERAISYKLRKKKSHSVGVISLKRRELLLSGTFGIFLALVHTATPLRKLRAERTIRPPGAIPEKEFLAKCIRCAQCIKACPTRVIQPDGLSQGIDGLFSPKLVPRIAGCDQECNVCGYVCPSNALRKLGVEEKNYARVGTAIIDKEKCIAYTENKLCLICDEICPYNAIVFHTISGYRRPVVIKNRCNGCGWCESACPVSGESAIRVSVEGEIRLRDGSYREYAKSIGLNLEKPEDLF